MVSFSFYESDNRIIRYAEALAERGDRVDVVALRRSANLPQTETINGVVLHRIQDRFDKDGSSAWSFLWPILRFLAASTRWLNKNACSPRFDVVHIHNIPDFLVFAGLPAKWRGGRLILDIHDIVPEFFASKFGARPGSPLVLSLKLMEKVSAGVADHVILANHIWFERYTKRAASARKCSVFLNHVDRAVFRPHDRAPRSDGPLIVYPGGLQWHQGIDIALRAFATVRERLPNVRFHIYGDGNQKNELRRLAGTLRLGDSVRFFDPLRLQEIARVMAGADIGVAPKRSDSFGNEAYSTKIMEFMSVGVPVIASDALVNRCYFDDSVVAYFESGNEAQLAQRMHQLLTDRQLRASLIENANAYVARNSWERHKGDYLRLVDSLASG